MGSGSRIAHQTHGIQISHDVSSDLGDDHHEPITDVLITPPTVLNSLAGNSEAVPGTDADQGSRSSVPGGVQEELLGRVLRAGQRVHAGEATDDEVATFHRLREELSTSFGDEHRAEDPTVQRVAAQAVLDETLAEHNSAQTLQVQARDRWPGTANPSYEEDFDAFQRAFRAARDRATRGEEMIPYLLEDATGGLGAREGGRGFGLELEFDAGPFSTLGSSGVRQAIARDLYAAGLTRDNRVYGYHASQDRGYTDARNGWRLETDCTVDGELVSPILYDEPETWRSLATVCEIIKSHGGVASMRTGGHIHVGMHDYDHDTANHHRLMSTFAAHEDLLYRLAQNPDSPDSRHRGRQWCLPNRVPSDGYGIGNDLWPVRTSARHGHAINLSSAQGTESDHAEFRLWDGSLNPGVIQAQVNLSLGITAAAVRGAQAASGERWPLGSNRRILEDNNLLGRRLRGEWWRDTTLNFRQLVDGVFDRAQHKEQATALFAATRWQR
ncbi:amidoligase family protein [Embleya sp. MST-111070]|uniref:amidoligase family protein n=1 Tax=Embleya sp. MST-111070 TaxID=3398231 RepID=UPI003F73EBDE